MQDTLGPYGTAGANVEYSRFNFHCYRSTPSAAQLHLARKSQNCCSSWSIALIWEKVERAMSGFSLDQEEEIEVLQSIFPTEFEQLDTPNKFKIHISPGGDEVHGTVACSHFVLLYKLFIVLWMQTEVTHEVSESLSLSPYI